VIGMKTWWVVALGLAGVASVSCKQMLDAGRQPVQKNPPSPRGASCVGEADSCQEGLSCVHYQPSIGDDAATCEIPCGSGCPDGMTCGTRTDPVFGAGAADVCL
jgi:hypothetical protein